jgi:parallel beta-helix repeat protein
VNVKEQLGRLTDVYIVLILGVGLTSVLLSLLGHASAMPPVAQVASYTVCSNGCNFSTIQAAVDAARDGDVIKVAEGIYTDVHTKPRNDFLTAGVVTQVVYISKTVAIQGGYTTTNWATPYPITQPTILDARGQGRAVYITGRISPTIEGLHITSGSTTGLKGYCYPSLACLDAGGGVYIITATATLSGCRIYSNTSSHFGGGVALHNSAATLYNNVIQGNNANITGWGGGGIFLSQSTAVLNANIISNNSATSSGGVFLYNSNDTLNHNTISDNSGNGVSLFNSAGTLNGNLISGNTGLYCGGGVRLEGSAATLRGNTISGNYSGNGGGVYVTPSAETVHDNAASGGKVYLYIIPVLSDNIISGNTASYHGGGVYIEHGGITLTGNIIFNNTASDHGGGVYSRVSYMGNALALNSNTILSNTAYSGGGVYLESSDGTLNNNTILSNTAQTGGGIKSYFSDLTLINNIIADNHANGGSGMYVEQGALHFLHTTFARNTGGDGLLITVDYIAPYYSTVALTNTILASHTVGIRVTERSTVTVNGVLWYSTPVTISQVNTATVNVQNQREGDPLFAMDGYHILTDSAAINGGVDAGVRGDIDNQPRPYQTPDLGADEYWPPGALEYVYLPFVSRDVP